MVDPLIINDLATGGEPWVVDGPEGSVAVYVQRDLTDAEQGLLFLYLGSLVDWLVSGPQAVGESRDGVVTKKLGQPALVPLYGGGFGLWIVGRGDVENVPVIRFYDLLRALRVFGHVVEFCEALVKCDVDELEPGVEMARLVDTWLV